MANPANEARDKSREESVFDNEDDDSSDTKEILTDMTATPPDPPSKRSMCGRCGRPAKVCLCPYFPEKPLDTSTCVYVIQHPNEESRSLRTVPILFNCLQQGKCCVIRGRRFSEVGHPELTAVCRSPNTLVLFPGPEAIDISKVPPLPPDSQSGYNLIVIDGTWNQARSMYKSNQMFCQPRQVQLCNGVLSEYVIRTQPTNSCLSTVESVAVSLAILEKRPEIQETLLRPLRALCQFQLDHGAAVHHSKEHLRENGLVYRPKSRPEDS
ncbi:tRNA-uridine aminocarboxypropyltransferase 2-like [Patiria miniata]|uniref:tRNA-uridine aminocarboxypropyltransferase n=1 Tax=Patiria miniata TaxID=46514 RepID=A0A914BCT9_PATMI|nr:tRNA-uridine aminocarboxypropyltransferase 2-like [Patiria miniata]